MYGMFWFGMQLLIFCSAVATYFRYVKFRWRTVIMYRLSGRQYAGSGSRLCKVRACALESKHALLTQRMAATSWGSTHVACLHA
jgi:hypothetical protein